ncbi:MAG: CAP domain-containing protein [Candidatus Doudnabacteria bacterium]
MTSFLSATSALSDDGLGVASMELSFPTFKKLALSVHDHLIPHHRNNYHPHILSHRMIALVSILAISIKIASLGAVAIGASTNTTQAAEITTQTVISLANQARSQNGLNTLQQNGLLDRAAQNKANDMLAKQYFAHNTPDGNTPWTFIKATGYSYTTAGENLAIDFTSAENVQAAWMNSPGHRANILNSKFSEIGIGIARGIFDNHQTTIVVQMFGHPVAQQVEVSPEPTPVAQAPASAPVSPPEVQPTTNNVQVSPESNTKDVPLGVVNKQTSLQGNDLYLEIETSGQVTKAIAFYGAKSILLQPVSENIWSAKIPTSSIGANDNLLVQLEDLQGHLHQEPMAQFGQDLHENFAFGEVNGDSITVFGTETNPRVWEEKLLLIILAALLTSLVIAIGIKRHIQHLSLIANTSFAAILIAMLMIL